MLQVSTLTHEDVRFSGSERCTLLRVCGMGLRGAEVTQPFMYTLWVAFLLGNTRLSKNSLYSLQTPSASVQPSSASSQPGGNTRVVSRVSPGSGICLLCCLPSCPATVTSHPQGSNNTNICPLQIVEHFLFFLQSSSWWPIPMVYAQGWLEEEEATESPKSNAWLLLRDCRLPTGRQRAPVEAGRLGATDSRGYGQGY